MKDHNFYFIVFNQNGIVKYEHGLKPDFLNNFIAKINPEKQIRNEAKVRDKIVEYEIRGPLIYLTASNKSILDKVLKMYNSESNTLSSCLEDLSSSNNMESTNTAKKNSLDFSIQSSNPKNRVLDIVSTSFSNLRMKTYSFFTSKIELGKLQKELNDHLIKKNVSGDLVNLITNDVVEELKVNGCLYVSAINFKTQLSHSIKKFLKTVNFEGLFSEIQNKKGPFSIFLIGPNGVGKSTTLAKITNYLLNKGLRVFISASDTFRAGAIEQLKIHVKRFQDAGKPVGFFESGYLKNDANVSKTAIIKAAQSNYDVVLVDTAGRMHNNVNLMRSLSKLCSINKPDHVIFVGEALTGNDSLDQINEFNKYTKQGRNNRSIDSIVLTKVEAVLSKIGQVLNLTFSTGIPVLFLGVGQTNTDLIALDINKMVDLLLSE